MPKRNVKEDKPKKRLGKKQLLLPPTAAGAATLIGLLIMHFIPTPSVLGVCLRADSVNTFNVYSRIELIVDKHTKLLPDDVGKQPKNGTECLRVIHTDKIGNLIHVQYVRPIRLTMQDFMKIYSYDNRTITVIDNSTRSLERQTLTLKNYDIQYSYFSEKGFTAVGIPSKMPPFTNNLLVRLELTPK
ncbi:MAG: hypothetical protein WCF06_15405 [Nitrososphaeraceae archaeon]